jgi:hypothetical protein
MGCAASKVRNNVSAGGQLEQPSEVKSSTRTAFEDAARAGSQNNFDIATSANAAIRTPTLWELDIIQKIRRTQQSYNAYFSS